MPLHLKFKIDAYPYFIWSFRCPQCNAHVPVTTDSKGRIPCPDCGYKFFKPSFDKKYEDVLSEIRTVTGAKLIDF